MESIRSPWVVGVGAALVDLLLEEDDQFVAKMGSPKGGMTLVELPHLPVPAGPSHQVPVRPPLRPTARMAPPSGSGTVIERSRGKVTVTAVPTPFVL